MKPSAKSIFSALAVSIALIVSAAALSLGAGRVLDASATDAATASLTTEILENSQFAHHRFDDKLATQFLQRYLDTLDGSHMIFLKSDIDEFVHFIPPLAQSMRTKGDTEPAHIIFKRYLERLGQRADFVAAELHVGHFDFTSHDRYEYDRKSAARPVDLPAAQQLWRENLRYEYLQEKLAGKKDADIAPAIARRSSRSLEMMKKLNDEAVLSLYLNALAHVYDPHSDYMGHEELQTFNMGLNLSLFGIGATLQTDDGYCKVGNLVPGGPAALSGQLKTGDRIVGVAQGDSKDFTDLVEMPLSQAVELIRGEKGSTVRLSIIPAGAPDAAPRKTISIIRGEIKLEDQQAKARIVELPIAGGHTQRLGVIDLPGFYASHGGPDQAPVSATVDVTRLVKKLKQENVAGIVLDLRRNGGGSLEEAIDLTGLFVPAGPVVQTRDLEGRVEVGKDHGDPVLYDGPLVVLTSRLSASASEIVAGALQDYGRAVIIGDPSTFGKGTVQTMAPLSEIMKKQGLTPSEDPGALKVTICKFYRPSGKSTQLQGVKSDIVLPSLTDIPEIGEAKLENPLPWDTIPAADFTSEDRVNPYLAALRARSGERVAKDPEFADLKKTAEEFRKVREAKTASLNEAERRAENARIENEKTHHAKPFAQPPTYEITLKNVEKPGLGDPVKDPQTVAKAEVKPEVKTPAKIPGKIGEKTSPTDDIILHETEEILADYADLLSRQTPSPIVTRR